MSQVSKCQGINKDGTPCKRNADLGSNFCWQHKNQEIKSKNELNYNLDKETELLMYSYLPLEEVLTIFKNDIETRDKIIKRYFKDLPDINDAS